MERSRGLIFSWAGFVLALLAFASYLFLFARYPITRDVPWANYILFALAGALLLAGCRRVFTSSSTRLPKLTAGLLTVLSIAIFGFFCFVVLIATKQLPASKAAPRVGEKAPEFSLQDTSGKQVTLSELLTQPLPGTPAHPPKGVILIFYRGYW